MEPSHHPRLRFAKHTDEGTLYILNYCPSFKGLSWMIIFWNKQEIQRGSLNAYQQQCAGYRSEKGKHVNFCAAVQGHATNLCSRQPTTWCRIPLILLFRFTRLDLAVSNKCWRLAACGLRFADAHHWRYNSWQTRVVVVASHLLVRVVVCARLNAASETLDPNSYVWAIFLSVRPWCVWVWHIVLWLNNIALYGSSKRSSNPLWYVFAALVKIHLFAL